jgi:hypothetical protein
MQKLSRYHHEDATGERKYSYGKLSVKAKHQQKVNILKYDVNAILGIKLKC